MDGSFFPPKTYGLYGHKTQSAILDYRPTNIVQLVFTRSSFSRDRAERWPLISKYRRSKIRDSCTTCRQLLHPYFEGSCSGNRSAIRSLFLLTSPIRMRSVAAMCCLFSAHHYARKRSRRPMMVPLAPNKVLDVWLRTPPHIHHSAGLPLLRTDHWRGAPRPLHGPSCW